MVFINSETIANPLKNNDQFDVVAVSSFIDQQEDLLNGLQVLTEWGLKCRSNDVLGKHWGYLADTDYKRHQNLHTSQEIPLKAFARGGWGAARVLEFDQPWKPGFLVGFSDVSAILLSRLAAGFDGGIHGPLITSLAKEPDWSKDRLRALLFGEPIPDLIGEGWFGGIAEGPLVICNLTVATHLLGSRHMPELKDAILVLEDIDEEPYRIDRMLTQWRLSGILQKLSGIAFGSFKGCETQEEDSIKTFKLNEVLKDRTMDLNIPVLSNLPIGHITGNAALPLGKQARLNANDGSLSTHFVCQE